MKIYTRTGDIGETSLFGGRRVLKSNLRIDTYGTVDELNSWIGLVADILPADSKQLVILKEVQDRLFTIGSSLAADPDNDKLRVPDLYEADIEKLESAIDEMELSLDPLKHFVLPGGHLHISYCHVARTVCRRAERLCVALHENAPLHSLIVKYLNRLSDYLFVLSRYVAKILGVEERKWLPRV